MGKRFNAVFPDRTIDKIEDLRGRTDASSATTVLKTSVNMMDIIVGRLEKGARFTATMPDGSVEEIHFLLDVRKEPA